MTSKKLTYLLSTVLGLICLAIAGGAYGVNSLLQGRSTTLGSLKAQNDTIASQQQQVLRDQQSLKKYDDLNTIAQTVVPQDKDPDIVVRQIISLASASGITDMSGGITFPSSTLGGSGSSTSGTASNPDSSKNKLTQLTPVKGISGVYDLPITVQQSTAVPYSKFLTFLGKLQQNRRTANISDVSITPDSKNPSQVTFTLTIDEYIKP